MNRKCLAVVVLSVWTSLALALTLRAQSVKPIYFFGNGPANPYAGLTLGPDGNFYGTAYEGGLDDGAVFKVATDGTLRILVNFNKTNGANPEAGVTLGPDGNFYGTTYYGGSEGLGTVFKVTTNGTLTTLANFNNANGQYPVAGLTLGPDGNFYGTTLDGGSANEGTVFQVTTNGVLTTLVNFNGNNGIHPYAGLTFAPDGNFYGATYAGGSHGYGTVFRMTTNGVLATLVSFASTNGAGPYANLTLGPDGNLFGTTYTGGSYGYGTVFRVTTTGSLTNLVSFSGANGAYPYASLTLGPDGNFYGTTVSGGYGSGTVFKMTTNGTFTMLVYFDGLGEDPANPYAGLTLGPDGNFYGTTESGGAAGTIFQLDLPPEFTMSPTNQTAVNGGSAIFRTQVFGTGPFAYQWLFNGIPVAGATNASLSFSPALANAMGSYELVVTNAFGGVTSQPVSLNVLLQPNIYAISNRGGGNFMVSLASFPNSTNSLWTSTNPALPFAQWQVIATNVTDGNGLSQFLDTNTAGMPQKFYRLSYP